MTNLRGEKRTEFPQSVRKKAFARCCRNGVPYCEGCGAPVRSGGFIYEHVLADGLAGEPLLENCKVHCTACKVTKDKADNAVMAKADRVLKRAYGLMPKKQPIASRGFPKRQRTHAGREPVKRIER
jgi:hypothetical protein